MPDRIFEQLKDAIQNKTALIVCGSGISKAADPAALDWRGLIRSGIEESVGWNFADPKWRERRLRDLDEGDVEEWISVADQFTDKLGGQDNGYFSRWLERTVGKLSIQKHELLNAILGFGCKISTTNYDDILAKASNTDAIPWIDKNRFSKVLRGEDTGILHLHGHWQRPESVILGTKSYQQIVADERAQFLQQVASFNYSLIFVGCSEDGLSDQNLGKLKVWLQGWNGHGRTHFHLVTNTNVKPNNPHFPIVMYGYGDKHDDLQKFLQQFLPETAPKTITAISNELEKLSALSNYHIHTIDHEVACEECFGRKTEIEKVVSALVERRTPIAIDGGPGMGKTTIAINALYDKKVIDLFGERRIFVALDAAREPHSILTSIVFALGLVATGGVPQLLSLIANKCSEGPIALILDNAETPHSFDAEETERIFKLLAQIEGLSLIISIRGTAPQFGQKTYLPNLEPLSANAAKDAFLLAAGNEFEGDPNLSELVTALEGHPLSLMLLGARARGQTKLNLLVEAYKKNHADLLKRDEIEREGRLTSTRASLKLSLDSPMMSSSSKGLFSLLAYLPDGLASQDAEKIFKENSYEAVSTLSKLRLTIDRKDDRLRVLAPLRECSHDELVLDSEYQNALFDLFLGVARSADNSGTDNWSGVEALVRAEAKNLDAIISEAIECKLPWIQVRAAIRGLANFHIATGMGSVSFFTSAKKSYSKRNDEAAYFLNFLPGRIAIFRGNYRVARPLLNDALHIARRAKWLTHQADCVSELAAIEICCSNYGVASSELMQARTLYQKAGAFIGYANCLVDEAKIAISRGEFKAAEAKLVEAKAIFTKRGTRRGETAAEFYQGVIAIYQGEYVAAESIFKRGVDSSMIVGSDLNKTNCIARLAEVAYLRLDHIAARLLLWKSLAMYQWLDDPFGKIFCEWRLGQLAILDSNREAGYRHFKSAMNIVRRNPDDLTLPGWEALFRAQSSSDIEEINREFQKARSIFEKLDRRTLIIDLIDHDPLGPSAATI